MLPHPTLEKLQALNLTGMVHALQEQLRMPEVARLSFEERLGLLVDREATEQENRRLARRLGQARLRLPAVVEDVDLRHPRGLDRALLLSLSSCQWIRHHQNCLITGPTGVGKTYLACALAHKACREGASARYTRLHRLLEELAVARADGSYVRRLTALSRLELLVLDDWGLAPLTDPGRRDLLEILDDRYDRRATLVASQLPVENWHEALGDPTLADAILDRLVHNAHRIALHGESLRKGRTTSRDSGTPPTGEASRDASQADEEE
jgi:DNA replication protein DnaC